MRLPPEQAKPAKRPAPRRTRRAWILVVVGVLLLVLLSLQGIANFYTDYLWYRSEHITFVWRTIVGTKLGLAAVFIAVMFLVTWLSLWFVDRMAPRALLFAPELDLVRRYQSVVGPHVVLVRTIVSAIVAFAVGEGAAGQWQNWVLFQHAQSFELTDPIFHRDAGFFVFRLPFLSFLVNWVVVALLVVFFVTAISHYLNGSIRFQGAGPRVDPIAIAHLSLLLGLVALVKAIGYYYVQRFELEFSTRGVVQGANYTDFHVVLPALTLLSVVALFSFAILAYNVYQRTLVLPIIGIGLWAVTGLAVGVIYPALVQAFKVTPSASTLELPFISDNMRATQYAFGIEPGQITQTSFPAVSSLTSTQATGFQSTLNNVTLWDPGQTGATFQKLQAQRSYFDLAGLAVDRYSVNDNSTPVVVGVRALDTAGIPSASWVNTHLQYTHGYGLVMSPANTATPDGDPNFSISQVPPVVAAGAKGVGSISQPAVYFGTQSNNYVVVNSAQPEIDYTDANGSGVQQSHYAGEGGVPIGSFWTRAAFALRFHDFNLLISKLITSKSQIIFVQGVRQMVQKAAPFLQVDTNPYPVLSGGSIYWVVDAYTESSSFPYSQSADTSALASSSGLTGSYNYVRNAVKVVVNAYTGQMAFYVIDPTDPLIVAYSAAFPGLFQPIQEMPPDLQVHLRYPQDLLEVQATMFGRYHLPSNNPSAFYNQANAWEVAQTPGTGSPSEPLPVGSNGSTARFQPVYELLQLDGAATSPRFVLVEPMVPYSVGDKLQTLSGFLVASCDADVYGHLAMYTTPQGVPGPALINSEINANQHVSGEISLLDQRGSTVTTGSVLLLPVNGALIYVRPIYISSSQNQFPQLQLVVAVYGNQVALEATLPQALSDIFNAPVDGVGVDQFGQPLGPQAGQVRILIQDAQQDELRAQAALASHPPDLGLYQYWQSQVASLVARAEALLGPPSKTPTPPPKKTSAPAAGASSGSGSSGSRSGSGSGSGSSSAAGGAAGTGSGPAPASRPASGST